jgi:hypothetical protein
MASPLSRRRVTGAIRRSAAPAVRRAAPAMVRSTVVSVGAPTTGQASEPLLAQPVSLASCGRGARGQETRWRRSTCSLKFERGGDMTGVEGRLLFSFARVGGAARDMFPSLRFRPREWRPGSANARKLRRECMMASVNAHRANQCASPSLTTVLVARSLRPRRPSRAYFGRIERPRRDARALAGVETSRREG